MSKKRKKIVYACPCCGYIYVGRKAFENLPDAWECPECTFSKDQFEERKI